MSASGVVKAGCFLIGLGVGIFGTTLVMKKELDKPIGEFEEYIPLKDRKDSKNSNDISKNGDEVEGNRKGGEDGHSNRSKDSGRLQNYQKDISKRGDESGRNRRELGRDERSGHGERNDRKESHAEFSSNQAEVLDYYRSASQNATRPENGLVKDKRRKEFDERRGDGPGNQTTRYSRMYQNEVVEEALHAANSQRGSRDSYEIGRSDSGRGVVMGSDSGINESYYDESGDDLVDEDYIVSPVYEEDPHGKFVMERVEDNIEIYLDDNPQDFVTMIFYEGDNTLCDDGEQIVPNAEEVIGLAALSRLIEGGPGAENGVIFVHNLKTSLNYEVVLDAGSYQDTVMGRFESHLYGDGGIGGSSR